MEIDLPERLSGERFDRILTLLVGIGAVVAALLVALELSSDRRSQRANAEASRTAVGSFEQLTTSSLAAQFKLTSLMETSDHFISAEIAGHIPADGIAKTFFTAEEVAAARQAQATERTIGVPLSGTIASTQAALSRLSARDAAAFRAEVNESSALVDEADRYGHRDSRTTFALTLLASGGALFGLAGVLRAGRAGWVALGTGSLALAAASAVGISAFLL